jgi:hypothetical protein
MKRLITIIFNFLTHNGVLAPFGFNSVVEYKLNISYNITGKDKTQYLSNFQSFRIIIV